MQSPQAASPFLPFLRDLNLRTYFSVSSAQVTQVRSQLRGLWQSSGRPHCLASVHRPFLQGEQKTVMRLFFYRSFHGNLDLFSMMSFLFVSVWKTKWNKKKNKSKKNQPYQLFIPKLCSLFCYNWHYSLSHT